MGGLRSALLRREALNGGGAAAEEWSRRCDGMGIALKKNKNSYRKMRTINDANNIPWIDNVQR